MKKLVIVFIAILSIPMTSVVFAGPTQVKLFSVNLPEGFSGPITQSSDAIEILAFTKPHEKRVTNSLIQFNIINLEQAPSDSPLQLATVTNENILLKMLGGIERRRTDFWKGNYREITIAGIPANKIEWSGYAEGIQMKGVFYTFIFQRHLYTISLQDIMPFAENNLIFMEKAIESIKK